jgi:hypothetical protein
LVESSITKQLREAKMAETNKKTEEMNKLVMEVLAGATELKKFDSPQDWWGWWESVTETYTLDKKLEASGTSTSSKVVGQKPPENDDPGPNESNPASQKGEKNANASKTPSGRSLPPGTVSPIGISVFPTGGGYVIRPINETITPGSALITQECLPAGTKIWTASGKIDIDRLKPGDTVLTQNIKTGELVYKPVLRTTVRPPEKLLTIQHENEVIRSTDGHPFWIVGKGWTKASEIKPGMQIHTYNRPSTVIEVKPDEGLVKTFNLMVEGNHNYFVGERGILSHDISSREANAEAVPGLKLLVNDGLIPQ